MNSVLYFHFEFARHIFNVWPDRFTRDDRFAMDFMRTMGSSRSDFVSFLNKFHLKIEIFLIKNIILHILRHIAVKVACISTEISQIYWVGHHFRRRNHQRLTKFRQLHRNFGWNWSIFIGELVEINEFSIWIRSFYMCNFIEPFDSNVEQIMATSILNVESFLLSISLIIFEKRTTLSLIFQCHKIKYHAHWATTYVEHSIYQRTTKKKRKKRFELFLVNTMKHKCLLIRASFHSHYHGSKIKLLSIIILHGIWLWLLLLLLFAVVAQMPCMFQMFFFLSVCSINFESRITHLNSFALTFIYLLHRIQLKWCHLSDLDYKPSLDHCLSNNFFLIWSRFN